jgi:uncharacterized protein YggE
MNRLVVLLPLLAACTPVTAQQPTPAPVSVSAAPPPTIVTSAIGEAQVTPDRAVLEVGVQTRATTAAAAAAENARRQRAIIDTLKSLGIPSELISTMNYNVYPEMRQERGDQQATIVGYNVNNTVRVEIRRIDQVGPIIDAVIFRGANVINSLSFYASNTDEPRRKAMAEAVARARLDAEALARSAGGSLGQLLELSSASFNQGPRPLFAAASVGRMAAEVAPTPISPGEQQLQVSVLARWQFLSSAR